MRVARPFLWALVLAAGFVYVTSTGHWSAARLLGPLRPGGVSWSEPASAAPAYTTDEQKGWFGLFHQEPDGSFTSVTLTAGINDLTGTA